MTIKKSGPVAYGVVEIAAKIREDRYKVAQWRQRSTHGMPQPDIQLKMGPVWLAATIEPWIRAMQKRKRAA